MTSLNPAPGYALVQLGERYSNLPTPEEKYNRHTSGVCIKVGADDENYSDFLIGKQVFWEEYQASERITHNDALYAFIKIEDIRGYESD